MNDDMNKFENLFEKEPNKEQDVLKNYNEMFSSDFKHNEQENIEMNTSQQNPTEQSNDFSNNQTNFDNSNFVILDNDYTIPKTPPQRVPRFDPYTGERLEVDVDSVQNTLESWDISNYNDNIHGSAPKIKKSKKGLYTFITIFAVVFLVVGTITVGINYKWFDNIRLTQSKLENNKPDLYLNPRPSTKDETYSDGRLSIKAIAKKVKPSVVGVVAYHKGISYQPTSQGSGIILSADGFIVTNAHVLFGDSNSVADGVKIVLDNGDEHEAKVIGYDTRTDLAVVKINATNLVPANIGDSSQCEVGEYVVAIGNPSGLELAGSVTNGIISATNRVIQYNGSRTMKVLQTNAAVNPGNSGGALVNEFGQVIGINSAGKDKAEYEGINFAIPTSEAKPIIDSLIENGYIKGRVRMGISFVSIDEVSARVNNVPTGLQVQSVEKNMDVFAKGIRVGDIITKLDDQKVITYDDIDKIMKNKKPGDSVKVSVYRFNLTGKSEQFDVNVNLVEDKTQVVQ